jgi:cyclic dehypoxanthinyl futalosine synthase
MDIYDILSKAIKLEPLNRAEALKIYKEAPTALLCAAADKLRSIFRADGKVSWIIDRNVNITNSCIAGCTFCNFQRKPGSNEVYITTIDEYAAKIAATIELGGDQILLQGGLHPKLGLDFYCNLFRELKKRFPSLKLHALGPPEIAHIARIEKSSFKYVLEQLAGSGLDSLPGAGAEILSDRVRKKLSPGKCSTDAWLGVMKDAHQMNLVTSATMMFGHIETLEERVEHLILLRELQDQKPQGAPGFVAFIPWPFMGEGTELQRQIGQAGQVSMEEYVRTIALSRIVLCNIPNIQASWLTAGVKTGQLCLHSGANDFGSIMIEENVVSAAGSSHWLEKESMQQSISDAGFIPQRRNQRYEYV